jgi:hypothetical protein
VGSLVTLIKEADAETWLYPRRFFLIAIIDQVLIELGASTHSSDLRISLLMRSVSFLGAIVALMVIHAIIHNRFTRIWCCGASRFRTCIILHCITPPVLSFLWMVGSILRLKFLSKYPDYDSGDIYHVMVPLANAYLGVNAAFHILYFVAALNILVCAILIFGEASARNLSGRVCPLPPTFSPPQIQGLTITESDIHLPGVHPRPILSNFQPCPRHLQCLLPSPPQL